MIFIMDKKIFYGEYTLLHWIELIQSRNIVLPKYQRSFVWTQEQVEAFLRSLKKGNFIPPVIIGAYGKENLILDGQQRLTSILLGYLGRMPKAEVFKQTDDINYIGYDGNNDDSADEELSIEWDFRKIIDEDGNNLRDALIERTRNEKYSDLSKDCSLDDNFLNSNYLGFSYIVPTTNDEKSQVMFYSTVFHDINIRGILLRTQEARRSLYFLDQELSYYFEPKVSQTLKIEENGKTVRYDFVRALAFMSQYHKQGRENTIARGCRRREALEQYFDDYINAVIEDRDDTLFEQFSKIVGRDHIEDRTKKLLESVSKLEFDKEAFRTIIDADMHLFGLIYYVYLDGKSIADSSIDSLKSDLTKEIEKFREDEGHKKSPNSITNLRKRIKASIDIYKGYCL